MFELEIIVTSYTILVVTTTVVFSKCIGRKRLNKMSNELSESKTSLFNAEAEIKQLKSDLTDKSRGL